MTYDIFITTKALLADIEDFVWYEEKKTILILDNAAYQHGMEDGKSS